MQKNVLIMLGVVLVLALSGYTLYLLSPLVHIIGWSVLIGGFAVGIFFLAKLVLKLMNK